MTPLFALLQEEIKNTPHKAIDFEHFMALALTHPRFGYYVREKTLGAEGDFITAPEISQIFGELIGVFFCHALLQNTSTSKPLPNTLHLLELGPGRGLLMRDILRTLRQTSSSLFLRTHVRLFEASKTLQKEQEKTLKDFARPLTWPTTLIDLPHAPLFVIANEFFDALPCQPYQFDGQHWLKLRIECHSNQLMSAWHRTPLVTQEIEDIETFLPLSMTPRIGDILEVNASTRHYIHILLSHIKRYGGMMLIIDYGSHKEGFHRTVQALRSHAYQDVLKDVGEQDITSHVNFNALKRMAQEMNCVVEGPLTQKNFLETLGIHERLEKLCARNPKMAIILRRQIYRLLEGEKGMGELMKIIIIGEHWS